MKKSTTILLAALVVLAVFAAFTGAAAAADDVPPTNEKLTKTYSVTGPVEIIQAPIKSAAPALPRLILQKKKLTKSVELRPLTQIIIKDNFLKTKHVIPLNRLIYGPKSIITP